MKEKAIVEEQRLTARLLLRENPDDREKLGQNTTLQRKLEEALGKSFQVLNYIKRKEEHLKEQKKADQEAVDFENQRKDESQEPALCSAGSQDKEESRDAAYDQNYQNQDYPGYKNQDYDDEWAKGYKDYSSDQAACSYDKYQEKGTENPRYQPYPPEANYKNQDYYGDNYSQGYKNQWRYKDDPKYQQRSWDWDKPEAYSQEAEAKDKRQDHYGDNSYQGYKNQENYKDDPMYQQQSWDWDQQQAYSQEAEAKDKRQDHHGDNSYQGYKNQENYKDDPMYQQQSWDWDQQQAYSQEAEAKDKHHVQGHYGDNSDEGNKNQEPNKEDSKYQQQSWDKQEAYPQEAQPKDRHQDQYGDNSNQEHYKEKPEDQKKTPKETPAETEEILEDEEEQILLERMQQKHAKQLKQLQEKQERELLQMRSHKRQKVDGVLPVGRLQSECPEPQAPGLVPEAEYLGLFEPFFSPAFFSDNGSISINIFQAGVKNLVKHAFWTPRNVCGSEFNPGYKLFSKSLSSI